MANGSDGRICEPALRPSYQRGGKAKVSGAGGSEGSQLRRPEQCLVVRFNGAVAFANGFVHAFNIGDLNMAPRIFDHPSLLERPSMQRHAGSLDAQHLSEKFLGELQIVAAC